MKPEDIKDLRELLGTIEFANAQLEQAVQKLSQFQDIEKLVPVLQSLKEIDLGSYISKINFQKIGEEMFAGVRQSINAQNTIITNSVQALEKKSKDLNEIVRDLQELDALSESLQTLKKSIKGFNIKMIAGSLILGLGMGTIGGYVYSTYIQPKPFEKLLGKRAHVIEESNGYKDILVITAPFVNGVQDGATSIAFTFPQQQTNPKKDQK